MKWFLALIGIVFFSLPLRAEAFSVSPLRYSATIDPGSSQVMRVEVENTDATTTVFAPFVDSLSQDESGRPVFGGQEASDVLSWVEPSTKELKLGPGEKGAVDFTVSVPVGAAPGSRFFALSIAPRTASSTMRFSVNSATVVILTVAGVVNESGSVEVWDAVNNIVFSSEWPFHVRLYNSGNVAAPLDGTVVFRDLFGREVNSQPFTLGNTLLVGSYRDLMSTVKSSKILWPGRYEVELRARYGESGVILTDSAALWYVPWYSWVIAAGLILIMFYIRGRARPGKDA